MVGVELGEGIRIKRCTNFIPQHNSGDTNVRIFESSYVHDKGG